MYGLPIVSIPVMIYFPAALGVYWVTNNFISLGQVSFFIIPDLLNVKNFTIRFQVDHKLDGVGPVDYRPSID